MTIPGKEFFQTDCRLEISLPLLAGISGGTDSLALLHLLVEAGYLVTVAHFDHQIQSNSATGAQFVKAIADKLECPFVLGTANVKQLAALNRESLEASARNARYRFLFDTAEKLSAQAVITGHTADDQVETILMHILRGSGIRGLAGMKPRSFLQYFSATIPLVRPLLGVSRAELDEYCLTHNLAPWHDLSNLDTSFTRNRVRRELIPMLGTYNPQIKDRILSLGRAALGAVEVIEGSVEKHYQEVFRVDGDGYCGYDRNLIREKPISLQVEIIRKGISQVLPVHEDIDQAAILRAAELLTHEADSQIDLADDLIAVTTGDRFYIALQTAPIKDGRFPQMEKGSTQTLEIPGELKLADGWVMYAKVMSEGWQPDPAELSGDPLTVFLNGDSLELPLLVRTRQDGDRIQPFGMLEGTMKLGDYFTNKKIPSLWRDQWPLVLSANHVTWVSGQQIGDPYKVTPTSRTIIKLGLKKEEI